MEIVLHTGSDITRGGTAREVALDGFMTVSQEKLSDLPFD